MPPSEVPEVIVVGGGPAGLSAALYLARYDRSVVVFDAGEGRSTHHQLNRNYLGFPGGVAARELRRRGFEQLSEYPQVSVQHERVDRLNRQDGGFVAAGRFGESRAAAVVLCTGVVEHYPEFEGWDSYVGRSMFSCITCDGYEMKGKKTVVAGNTDVAACEALQLSRLCDDVTLLTDSLDHDIREPWWSRLGDRRIPVIVDEIKDAEGADGRLAAVHTVGERVLPLEALFVVHAPEPRTALATMVGAQLAENGYIVVDVNQKTTVAGVFAAGDVTRLHSHQVSAAVHEGGQAASAANSFLYPPELRAE